MNKHYFIGNLVRDPEKHTTDAGVNYCVFTVAVNKQQRKDGQQDADFYRVTAWRGLADSCAQYLQKGRKVFVCGTPSVSVWTGKDGQPRAQIEVTAQDVEFIGGNGSTRQENAGSADMDAESGMTRVDPEDLPY